MSDTSANNKRIAKNTLLLYVRTILVMLVSLYTSRVILDVLGVEDYGIYNVVGGVVAMFSIMSGSLSVSISRFITFELGRNDKERLNKVFSMSVNIQVVITLIVLLAGGLLGGWFLNGKMNIPMERMAAANWVLYCSLAMFCINLISIPYNACIIAHEHMNAFAYVSILDVFLKLVVCYMIAVSPFDKLISYAILLTVAALLVRVVYDIYCKRHFVECRYRWIKDTQLLKQMLGFAGWSFLTNTCVIFNTQGVNILINIFFGVALNAARGIANQVDAAIMQFVNNFTMTLNPQITKNYATGNIWEMFKLVCRGSRFSYFLLLLFAMPVMFEAEQILSLWLKTVPDHTIVFLRLTIIGSMINMLGNTGYTACMATGNIRSYMIIISGVVCLVFPLTWVAFRLGFPAESAYIAYILVYLAVVFVRLYVMKNLLRFPPMMFVKDVLWKIVAVTSVAVTIPLLVYNRMDPTFLRLVTTTLVCMLSTCMCVYTIGLTRNERTKVKSKAVVVINGKIGYLKRASETQNPTFIHPATARS